MKKLIIITLTWAMYLIAHPAQSNTGLVEKHIKWFLQNVKKSRTTKALKLVPHIYDAGKKYELDSLLLSTIIATESAYRVNVTGAKNEIGLGQIMPHGVCAKGQNLSTPRGQIFAAARCFRLGFDKYKHRSEDYKTRLYWAMSFYNSGKNRINDKAKKRINKYFKIRARLIGEIENAN